MTDILKQLARMSWRGIEVPVTSRGMRFSQQLAQHKFSFRDGEIVEPLGAENLVFDYSIPFREDIAKGPYQNLFTVQLVRFLDACRNRQPGPLVDPVLGEFRATCLNVEDTTDVNRRDGTDVRVQFIHAPELDVRDELLADTAGLPSAAAQAKALDAEIAKIPLADLLALGLLDTPDSGVDLLSAIDGIGRQIESAGNRISAKIDQVAFKLEKIESTVDRLSNPTNWPAKRTARRLRDMVLRLKTKSQNLTKTILKHTLTAPSTLSAVAAFLGISVQVLMATNPGLSATRPLPAGTVVKYPAREAA